MFENNVQVNAYTDALQDQGMHACSFQINVASCVGKPTGKRRELDQNALTLQQSPTPPQPIIYYYKNKIRKIFRDMFLLEYIFSTTI